MAIAPVAATMPAAIAPATASLDASNLAGVGLDRPRGSGIAGNATGADFMSLVGDGLARADGSLKAADSQLRRLAAGEDVPLHDVMISMERARLDLMLVVEVRNRLVEAYQELSRMQL